jgi:hypothetical protein
MNPNRRHRIALALLSVPLVMAVAACGAGANEDSASKSSVPAAGGAADSVSGDAPANSDYDREGAGGKADQAAVIDRSVIATGSLSLTTAHLDDRRRDAISRVTGLGGHVDDEQSRSDGHGRLDRVDLTLRVPSTSFEKALDALGELGTVRHRQQSVEDVTTKVIDINARVKAQAASVASFERLLARATTIAEIMSVESQLSSRQADLDSLKQQQKWLSDQTSMSTIQLSMSRPPKHEPAQETRAGFLGGLEGGWHALGATVVVVGTAVGAVLPFVTVLALVGVPVWLLLRRRRTPEAAVPAPEA